MLEGELGAEGLDGGIHTAPAGDFEDFLHHVDVPEVQRDIGAHLSGDFQARVDTVHDNDAAGPAQFGTGGGAQTDGPLGENGHDVADLDISLFGAAETGGHDVRAHQHLFVGKCVRNRSQVGLGIGHQHVFGLGAVDGIAEAPAAHGFVAVAAAAASL